MKKNCNEWKATKLHVHAQSFSVSFPAWEDLLKFDTTSWNSYHWNIYTMQALRWSTNPHTLHKLFKARVNDYLSMPKSTGKKGPPLPWSPVRVTTASHSCMAEATATAIKSIGDAHKLVQIQDQSNFEVCPICLEPTVEASDQVEGHNAIFCEGDGCQAWYHILDGVPV